MVVAGASLVARLEMIEQQLSGIKGGLHEPHRRRKDQLIWGEKLGVIDDRTKPISC